MWIPAFAGMTGEKGSLTLTLTAWQVEVLSPKRETRYPNISTVYQDMAVIYPKRLRICQKQRLIGGARYLDIMDISIHARQLLR